MAKELLLSIRLDQETRQLIDAAAAAAERTASDWARRELRRAAERARLDRNHRAQTRREREEAGTA